MTHTPSAVLLRRAAVACRDAAEEMDADDNLRAPTRLLALAFERRADLLPVPALRAVESDEAA